MNKFKFIGAGLLALSIAAIGLAQQYTWTSLGTTEVDAPAESNMAAVINLAKYQDVALVLKVIGGDPAATATGLLVRATFKWSVNGIDYCTAPISLSVTGPVAGTTVMTVSNKMAVGAVGYLQWTAITNTGTGVITGQVWAATKPNRYGNR